VTYHKVTSLLYSAK